MGRKSSILRHSVDVRDEINERMDSGETLDELVVWLRSIGITNISRSALHRWSKQLDRIMAKARRARVVAEVVTRRLKDMPESRLLQANVESMHGVLMQLIDAAENDEGVTIDSKNALELSRAIGALAQAEKAGAEKVIKVEEYKEEAAPEGAGGVGIIEIAFVEPEPKPKKAAKAAKTKAKPNKKSEA